MTDTTNIEAVVLATQISDLTLKIQHLQLNTAALSSQKDNLNQQLHTLILKYRHEMSEEAIRVRAALDAIPAAAAAAVELSKYEELPLTLETLGRLVEEEVPPPASSTAALGRHISNKADIREALGTPGEHVHARRRDRGTMVVKEANKPSTSSAERSRSTLSEHGGN